MLNLGWRLCCGADYKDECFRKQVKYEVQILICSNLGYMFDFIDNIRKPKPLVPNAETVAAMRAAQRGDVKSFKSIDALMKDLKRKSR